MDTHRQKIRNKLITSAPKPAFCLYRSGVTSFCPKMDDYPIFFAVSEKGGKDNSGDYVYVKNDSGQDKLDTNGHLIVDHDLHNHAGELPDGIAEAFIDWAKGENLSFWRDEPCNH